jgi:hypothetical protein
MCSKISRRISVSTLTPNMCPKYVTKKLAAVLNIKAKIHAMIIIKKVCKVCSGAFLY